jgi:hypothetical protein
VKNAIAKLRKHTATRRRRLKQEQRDRWDAETEYLTGYLGQHREPEFWDPRGEDR